MAFADPQTVTISAVANSLARTSSSVNAGVFTKDDGNVQLQVSHAYGKRNRRLIKLTHSKVAADPLISAQNIKYSMSIGVTVDVPVTGYTVAEAKAVIDGFIAYMSASSGLAITKLLGGEN